eukprot:1354723-Amphidinium_carterae.1
MKLLSWRGCAGDVGIMELQFPVRRVGWARMSNSVVSALRIMPKDVIYYDEVLTSSARLYALTSDVAW